MTFTIGLVKIPVSDFARARAFYADVLGLTEAFASAEYGWAQYDTGAVPLCLYVAGRSGGTGTPGGETGVQLRVADVRALHAGLTARGATPGPLDLGDDGTSTFDLADPDGNRLQVAQVPVEA